MGAELIDKWEVVHKLIRLQNNYQFYKKKWDADVLYRRIRELEVGIVKTPGIELVRCKDCASGKGATHKVCPLYKQGLMKDDDYCSVGERKCND